MKISTKQVLPLLRCPESHSALYLEDNFLVNDTGVRYPIQEGIIDLVKQNNQKQNKLIEAGYNNLKSMRYNLLILNPLYLSVLWGFGSLMTPFYMLRSLEAPTGWILDIPCGSGIFSTFIYKSNPHAKFIAVDYSMEMLKSAQSRAKKKGIDNVIFIRADVANLPFAKHIFAGAFSFAGFHAFPDPSTAGQEMGRVLQNDSPLLMTAVCRGIRHISDYMIDRYMIPRGYFSNSLTASKYTSFLTKAGIRKLQVTMAGAIMIAKGYKIGIHHVTGTDGS